MEDVLGTLMSLSLADPRFLDQSRESDELWDLVSKRKLKSLDDMLGKEGTNPNLEIGLPFTA